MGSFRPTKRTYLSPEGLMRSIASTSVMFGIQIQPFCSASTFITEVMAPMRPRKALSPSSRRPAALPYFLLNSASPPCTVTTALSAPNSAGKSFGEWRCTNSKPLSFADEKRANERDPVLGRRRCGTFPEWKTLTSTPSSFSPFSSK
jgi:hypothetical protein